MDVHKVWLGIVFGCRPDLSSGAGNLSIAIPGAPPVGQMSMRATSDRAVPLIRLKPPLWNGGVNCRAETATMTEHLHPGQVISETCPTCGGSVTTRARLHLSEVERHGSDSIVWLVDC